MPHHRIPSASEASQNITGTVLSFCVKSNYIPIETYSEFLILLRTILHRERKTKSENQFTRDT